MDLIYKLFKCYDILVKADKSENDMIFNYNSLIINKNKENNKLIDKTNKNDEFEKKEEEDYNN